MDEQHDELGAPALAAARAELVRSVDLQAGRVRALPLTRLERAAEGERRTRAEQLHEAAQALADLAADAEGQPRRPLPVLAVHGLGDQLAVVGHDVAAAGDAAALAAAHEQLARVRRAL
ncbi:hypothetical protein [Kineococcus sp. SYSU DK006]|uniref:hypothetical protein n=1 Tax=Kineococcus sp. SYSU DK006 TaxID=3383127 RepID=UPI003D7E49A5